MVLVVLTHFVIVWNREWVLLYTTMAKLQEEKQNFSEINMN